MPLNIIRNDITRVRADAIVNTANPQVAVGAGVDQAIYEAAGMDQLLEARAKIGPMQPGQAAATQAFALDAKYIIHTVGPVWRGGSYGEREAVASCYRESLRLADELQCESVAFPLISTGTYGFPKDEALRIAVSEISSFLFTHDMTVYMVVYSKEAFVISSKAFADIKTFIEDKDVREAPRGNYYQRRRFDGVLAGGLAFREHAARKEKTSQKPTAANKPAPAARPPIVEEPSVSYNVSLPEDYDAAMSEVYDEASEDAEYMELSMPSLSGEALPDILKDRGETFQQMLFRLIDRKGLTDPQVYKKANIDRKPFSKIRSNEDYVPSKRTVLAFAVALELSMDETIDLLQRAGLALSPSSRFDLIVGYCINHRIYDIFEINDYLFYYDEPLLVG